jgi:hypothetical protein
LSIASERARVLTARAKIKMTGESVSTGEWWEELANSPRKEHQTTLDSSDLAIC